MRPQQVAARKIVRKPAVEEMTGLNRTTIWREEKAGRFPERVQITANSVGWYEDEVLAWIHQRIRGGRESVTAVARVARAEKLHDRQLPPPSTPRRRSTPPPAPPSRGRRRAAR